ncbi:hypothetical protein [Polaromonas sp.]|uniref:hypothetical protein n=1 Tax=Polaromonas sp. TaxID=1869339 RepID=UPI00352A6D5E
MANFTISRDHLRVLRLRRQATPKLNIEQQELIELSVGAYGHLVERNETLTADAFIGRIRAHYDGGERQTQIEQAILACEAPVGARAAELVPQEH